MKRLFFIFLLANLVFFGVMQAMGERGGEPVEAHQPHNADKVRLVTAQEAQKLSEQKRVLTPPTPAVCLEWGRFGGDDAARAQQALDKLQLGENAVTRKAEAAADYWVYIPPLNSKLAAQRKANELKALGIAESYVFQDAGKRRNAISLGVFSTEEAAARYQAQLQEKGVKTAKVMPRSPEGGQTAFLIKSVGEKIEAELVRLKQEFSGSELKAVECK